jgi:CubicO group peptidase (beta-lactamase class C family)
MLLVTDVTKKPFPQFMQETVLGPAGMTHSTYEQPLPAALVPNAATGTYTDGQSVKGKYHTYPEMSAAGLWTTASDLAKLAIELQRTYAGQSSKVIDQATFKQMVTVQKAPFGIGYMVDGTGPDLSFEHGGADEGFQALFIAFAERGQGFMAMANSDNGIALINEIAMSVADEYHWPNHHPEERTVIVKDAKALGELAGEYALSYQGLKALVTLEGDKLVLDVPGGPLAKDELLADSDSTFFLRASGTPVVFQRDAKGKPAGIVIAGGVKGKKVK